MLSKIMSNYHNKPVMLFLDEYDVPLQNAYVEGYYEECIKFFKTFYGITFKDNPYLEKTILTGVSRVAKESIFSGANNFHVYTVLDDEFSDDFGITEKEMDKIIDDFEIQDQKEEIKKWYDGYTIGNTEGIYNPWSILNYLTDKKLIPYWVNTSSNDLIKLILKNSATVKEKIEQLLRDEEIEVPINLETVIVGIEKNEENIWGLLLGTGYLKVTEIVDLAHGIYKVKIPNYEIKFLFQNIIREWFNDKVIGNNLNTILKDLVTLNLEEFEEKFKQLVIEMFSFMDVGKNTAENFYHAFVLGMLVGLKDSYYVKSNRESGFGRYDIMLEPIDKANAKYPGTGAAGGMGFAFLTFLHASLESGIKIVLEETRLSDFVKDADIVITGEGRLDGQTVTGKAPIGVAKIAKEYGKPVIAFSGCVTKNAVACNAKGIDAFFPVLRGVVSLDEAMCTANAMANMEDTVEQVFRLIRTFA